MGNGFDILLVLKQYLRKFHGYAQLEFFLLLPENKENHFPQVSPTTNDFYIVFVKQNMISWRAFLCFDG